MKHVIFSGIILSINIFYSVVAILFAVDWVAKQLINRIKLVSGFPMESQLGIVFLFYNI